MRMGRALRLSVLSHLLTRRLSSLPSNVTGLSPHSSNVSAHTTNQATDRASARALFGQYGLESGVEIGKLWPTVEEAMEEMTSKTFVDYKDTLKSLAALQAERENRKKIRLDKLEKNIKNYPETIANYEASQKKAESAKSEQEAILERRMREIHEYFGYWMDPKDPRFEVMLKQKEAEERKAEKLAKRAELLKKKIAEVAQ